MVTFGDRDQRACEVITPFIVPNVTKMLPNLQAAEKLIVRVMIQNSLEDLNAFSFQKFE